MICIGPRRASSAGRIESWQKSMKHYTGHRSRALWLERLIAYMKSKPGVWFATHEEVATYVKKAAEDFH